MRVDLHASQATSFGHSSSDAWGTAARAALMAVVLVGGVSVIAASQAVAQEAAAPAKSKAAKPKVAAKAKAKSEPTDDDGAPQAPAATAKRDPAQAQRSLESGIKLLQSGKAEQAIQTLSTVIAGGNVPPQIMARALHQRGAAYRLTGKPAQAVSDLTSALWLKGGLTDAERTDAVQQRAAAYREAGIPDQPDSSDIKTASKRSAPSAVGASQGTGGSAQPVTTASLAPETSRPAEQPSPLGNFFSNLFGGGSNTSSDSTQSTPAPAASAGPQAAASSWSSGTTTSTGAAPKTARAAAMVVPPPQPGPQAAPAAPTPAKAAPTGGVDARMIMRSEAEANALASKLTSEFGTILGGRSPSVSQAQFGGMGSFFQVRIGPYKSTAEAQDLCKRIKSTGADCVAVTQ